MYWLLAAVVVLLLGLQVRGDSMCLESSPCLQERSRTQHVQLLRGAAIAVIGWRLTDGTIPKPSHDASALLQCAAALPGDLLAWALAHSRVQPPLA
jgi:hypothetical protein